MNTQSSITTHVTLLFLLIIILFLVVTHTLAQSLPTQGLVGYWKFDEGVGTSVADSSGSSNTGTLVNSPTWVVGKIGSGLGFGGTSYIDFGSQTSLDNLPGISASFWIKLNVQSDDAVILSKANQYGSAGWFLLFGNQWSPRKVRFIVSHLTSNFELLTNEELPVGQWTHVAVAWDGSTNASNGHIYINGIEATYGTRYNAVGTRADDGSYVLNMAALGLSPSSPNANIDEMRIYNRVLTQAEVLAIYTSGDVTPPVISSVAVSGIEATAATVTWTTDELSDTQVEYGPTSSLGSLSTLDGTLAKSHSVTLTGLSPSTIYSYRVRSKDANGNFGISSIATFTTPAPAPPDTTPPAISSIAVTGITKTSATITWATNESADSQIEYGTTVSLGTFTPLDSALVTSHSVTLQNLLVGTQYSYRVNSKDAAGNLGQSSVATFATLAPPPQLTAGGIVSLPQENMGPNVNLNSGFESLTSGQPTGWFWGSSPFTADTTVKRSGAVSLRLTAPMGATDTASYKVFLKKGTYTLTGYIKTQNLTSVEPHLDSVRMEVTTGGWPPCCGSGYGQPVYVNAGDVNWTYREETRITITTDTDVYITVRALGSITGGQVWFDDIEFREILPKPLDVFMLYPNYRGYLFDDYSQTAHFDVTVTPPTGTTLSEYRVEAKIFDEIASTTIRTDTFIPSANFTANVDGAGFVNDRTYLATFRLVRLSDSAIVYEYPAYRISKIAGSKRSAMTVSFDEKNRMFIRGQPFFPLSVFDAGTPLTTSPAAWESTLTTYRRLFEIPLNNYINYHNGGAQNPSMLPLLDLFQSKGITDFGIANCFERTTVDAGNTVYPFWLLNAPEAEIKTRAEHPAFIGFYVNDECHHSMVPNTFMHYQDIKRLDPDGITLGSSNTPGAMYLWRDSLDLFALDPYPLYGTEPSGGYPLNLVADWIITLRNELKSSRPFWIDLQFFQTTGGSRWPTANEMKSMAYMGIVEGANGATWWSLGVRALAYVCNPSTDWCAARIDYYNRLKLIMNELKSLELVLLSDDRPDLFVSNSNPAIHTRVKYHNNKGYIFSYNYNATATTATFTWNQNVSNVDVFNEGRKLSVSGNQFTDTFTPYAAHVYVVSTGSTVSLIDTTPPVISGVAANAQSTIATITWNTNELSDSQVEYGSAIAYGNSMPLDTKLITLHSQTITGLVPNTLYHFRVKSQDISGNLAVSGDFTFTTLAISEGMPIITITSPAIKSFIAGTEINMSYTKSGNLTGVSYAVFQLDGNPPSKDLAFNGTYKFTNVPYGTHKIMAYLARADNTPIKETGTYTYFAVGTIITDDDFDHDGVPNLNDRCPFTPLTYKDNVGADGCPIPIYTKFSPELTTIFKDAYLSNISNFYIGIRNRGKIKFGSKYISLVENATTLSVPIDLDSIIDLQPNKAIVNSDLYNTLNISATVTLFNVSVTNPVVKVDGSVCTECKLLAFQGGNVTFSVPHWTEYSVGEGAYCGDSLCSSLESCSTCSADCGSCSIVGVPSGSGGGGGGGGAGSGGGGGTGGIYFVCNMQWKCSEWSSCSNGLQTRECNLAKVSQYVSTTGCDSEHNKPATSEKCVITTTPITGQQPSPELQSPREITPEQKIEIQIKAKRLSNSFIIAAIAFVFILIIGGGAFEINSLRKKHEAHDKKTETVTGLDKLKQYIEYQRREGKPDRETRDELLSIGWHFDTIDKFLK